MTLNVNVAPTTLTEKYPDLCNEIYDKLRLTKKDKDLLGLIHPEMILEYMGKIGVEIKKPHYVQQP